MSDAVFESIPVEAREGARTAWREAFGRVPLDGLAPVPGGASGASIYRADAGDRAYLLRLETLQRGGFRDPQRSYACMRIAAEAGIAPRVHYADANAGVVIMDFVSARPLTELPGGDAGIATAMGDLIARLQGAPTFPPLADYLWILDRLLQLTRSSGLFAAGLLDPHQEGFARIREAYRWDSAGVVSSHNDPNPGNILFDGARLWMIDWETSFRNDPLVDIAIVANNADASSALQDVLLKAWLGRAPDRLLHARLTLMRQLTRLYYAGVMFSIAASVPRESPDANLLAMNKDEFRTMAEQGRIEGGMPETMRLLGKIYLAAFLDGLSAPGFDEALAIARAG